MTLDPRSIAVILGALGVILAIALVALWRWYKLRRRRLALVARITSVSLDHVRDVLVPDGNGGVLHVDWVLLTPRGLLVVDLREVVGNVFGSDQMSEWTVMDKGQRHTFPNPLGALYDRIAAVKALVVDVPVEGRIVFAREASFPKGMPRFTVGEESIPGHFPLGERSAAEKACERFRQQWERLKGQVAPSPMVKR